jgi:hypothetical protein
MILAAALTGCGSKTSSNQPKVSGLKKRVLLSNQQSNTVNLLDAQKDTFTTQNMSASAPAKLLTAGGITIVQDFNLSDLTVIDNTKEQATFTAILADQAADIAISPDGKTGWVAQRNTGGVQFVSTADGSVGPVPIPVPAARRLVMSPNGSKLLVFSDPQAQAPPNTHSFFVIDTATKTVQTITNATFLDQPVTAVFGTSETQAFILNCGPECGGTAAGVASVDFSGAPVFAPASGPVAVPGATVGLLNGSTLYVAGTPSPVPTGPSAACPLSRCGELTIINTSSLTAGTPIPITDGVHQKMALTNGRLYVGAGACTVDPGSAPNTVRGCLSVFNVNTPGTTFPQESSFRQNFDVTGLQPISNRTVLYVVQGGELDIFDTTTGAVATGITPIDIVGRAIDVVQIDP